MREYLKSYSYVWTGTLYRVSLHIRFKYLMVFLLHVQYLPVRVKGLNPSPKEFGLTGVHSMIKYLWEGDLCTVNVMHEQEFSIGKYSRLDI